MNYGAIVYYPLTEKQIYLGINFLFPELLPSSKTYKKLKDFIVKEYKSLGTCVLCGNRKLVNDDFPDLMEELNLPSIGRKEVIINETNVQRTADYCKRPVSVFSRELPSKFLQLRKRRTWL